MNTKMFLGYSFLGFLVFMVAVCLVLLVMYLQDRNWPYVALMFASVLMNVQSFLTFSKLLKDE